MSNEPLIDCFYQQTMSGMSRLTISSIFTRTPLLSRRTSVDTLSTSLTPHIILIIQRSTPSNLVNKKTIVVDSTKKRGKTFLIS